MISTSLGSVWAIANNTMRDRSPATRASSITFSLSSPGAQRHSHAIISPALALFVSLPGLCSFLLSQLFILRQPGRGHTLFPGSHGGIRTFEQNILFDPHEEPIARANPDRRLNIQIPPSHLDSKLAYLLPYGGAGLLADALALEHGRVLALTQFNSHCK